MQPDIVVDVGNTRIKWGRCQAARVSEFASVASDPTPEWDRYFIDWNIEPGAVWVISGVDPARRDALIAWVREREGIVYLLESPAQLPIRVELARPEWVGIDRLLNAVAAASRRAEGAPAIIVGAGTAVTVDCIDATGAFTGGVILPGFRLMAHALHEHTALLPLVAVDAEAPPYPAKSTIDAMKTGIFAAVTGGVQSLIGQLQSRTGKSPQVFATGGDAGLIVPALPASAIHWPMMTLEGIRLSVKELSQV
jgi:type III pantothenate kinase